VMFAVAYAGGTMYTPKTTGKDAVWSSRVELARFGGFSRGATLEALG